MSIDLGRYERFSAVPPLDHRHSERRDCDLAAALNTLHGESRARIVNISGGGLSFTIDTMLRLKPGERITMRQQLLGEVRCIVRWTVHPRYGAAFEPDEKMPPGVRTFYDSLGPQQRRSG
jgi:hypothetical protein